jgi:hypothetical protein
MSLMGRIETAPKKPDAQPWRVRGQFYIGNRAISAEDLPFLEACRIFFEREVGRFT